MCGNSGSLQLFINKQAKVTYARVKHRIHENQPDHNPNIKYNYKYCKISDSKQLETLLNSVNIQYPKPNNETPSLGQLGQCGQDAALKTHDPQLRSSSFICQNKWAGSSVRIEHHPPKVGVVGSNPTPPACLFFLGVEVKVYLTQLLLGVFCFCCFLGWVCVLVCVLVVAVANFVVWWFVFCCVKVCFGLTGASALLGDGEGLKSWGYRSIMLFSHS